MRMFYMLVFCVVAYIGLSSRSAGAGAVLGADRSGSPVSNGAFCGNPGCHGSAFNTAMTIEMLNGGTAITEYVPGQTYKLKVSIQADAGATRFGYQASTLTGTDNVQAGNFGTAPTGQAVVVLAGNRQYAEQKVKSTSNVFEIDWTAPAAGTGAVTVYSSVVAANNNNDDSGDGAKKGSLVLGEMTSSTHNVGLANIGALKAFPNPIQDKFVLEVEALQSGDYQVHVFDIFGKQHFNQSLFISAGRQSIPVNTASWSSGVYHVVLSNTVGAQSIKVIK